MFVGRDERMNLKIGEVIYRLRKEHHLTQEQLAQAIGVSVPAVSKWETGTTYPDITLLPKIARFFECSIDELMAYEQKLTPLQINQWLAECKELANKRLFDEMIEKCTGYLRQYPKSNELKLAIASFYLMEKGFAPKDILDDLSKQAISLLEEVASGTDASLMNQANYLLAGIYIQNQEDEKAEKILLQMPRLTFHPDDLLIAIYLQRKENKEVKQRIQRRLFNHLSSIRITLGHYRQFCVKQNQSLMTERLLQIEGALIELFELEALFGVSYTLEKIIFFSRQHREEEIMSELTKIIDQLEHTTMKMPTPLFGELELNESLQSERFPGLLLQLIVTDPTFEGIRSRKEYPELIKRLEGILQAD